MAPPKSSVLLNVVVVIVRIECWQARVGRVAQIKYTSSLSAHWDQNVVHRVGSSNYLDTTIEFFCDSGRHRHPYENVV